MNIVKIKNIHILCVVGWNKNYIQDARYVRKNSWDSTSKTA